MTAEAVFGSRRVGTRSSAWREELLSSAEPSRGNHFYAASYRSSQAKSLYRACLSPLPRRPNTEDMHRLCPSKIKFRMGGTEPALGGTREAQRVKHLLPLCVKYIRVAGFGKVYFQNSVTLDI